MKPSNLAAALALSSLAALPACSMFGGGGSRQASRPATTTQSYAAAPNYNSPSQMGMQNAELTPDMIRKVQQNLNQAGLYKGRADGVWGPRTQAAVRDYQQQHNLNATGQLDEQTLGAMDLAAANNQDNMANQNSANGQQPPPANQSYGSNYNPPPNNTGQANYNPPPPSNQPTNDTNSNNTNTGTMR